MQAVAIAVILIILVLWICGAVFLAVSQRDFSIASILNICASACMVVGIIGFVTPALLSVSKIEIPNNMEWPTGYSTSALPHPSGVFIVPHEPTSRLQIYDGSSKFIRGWQINSATGSVNLQLGSQDSIVVYAARSDKKYQYDLEGNLLFEEFYSGTLPSDRNHLVDLAIPTPAYLIAFTHPLIAWIIAALGMFLAYIGNYLLKRKESKTSN